MEQMPQSASPPIAESEQQPGMQEEDDKMQDAIQQSEPQPQKIDTNTAHKTEMTEGEQELSATSAADPGEEFTKEPQQQETHMDVDQSSTTSSLVAPSPPPVSADTPPPPHNTLTGEQLHAVLEEQEEAPTKAEDAQEQQTAARSSSTASSSARAVPAPRVLSTLAQTTTTPPIAKYMCTCGALLSYASTTEIYHCPLCRRQFICDPLIDPSFPAHSLPLSFVHNPTLREQARFYSVHALGVFVSKLTGRADLVDILQANLIDGRHLMEMSVEDMIEELGLTATGPTAQQQIQTLIGLVEIARLLRGEEQSIGFDKHNVMALLQMMHYRGNMGTNVLYSHMQQQQHQIQQMQQQAAHHPQQPQQAQIAQPAHVQQYQQPQQQQQQQQSQPQGAPIMAQPALTLQAKSVNHATQIPMQPQPQTSQAQAVEAPTMASATTVSAANIHHAASSQQVKQEYKGGPTMATATAPATAQVITPAAAVQSATIIQPAQEAQVLTRQGSHHGSPIPAVVNHSSPSNNHTAAEVVQPSVAAIAPHPMSPRQPAQQSPVKSERGEGQPETSPNAAA